MVTTGRNIIEYRPTTHTHRDNRTRYVGRTQPLYDKSLWAFARRQATEGDIIVVRSIY